MTTSAYPGPACEAVGLTKSTLLAATGSHPRRLPKLACVTNELVIELEKFRVASNVPCDVLKAWVANLSPETSSAQPTTSSFMYCVKKVVRHRQQLQKTNKALILPEFLRQIFQLPSRSPSGYNAEPSESDVLKKKIDVLIAERDAWKEKAKCESHKLHNVRRREKRKCAQLAKKKTEILVLKSKQKNIRQHEVRRLNDKVAYYRKLNKQRVRAVNQDRSSADSTELKEQLANLKQENFELQSMNAQLREDIDDLEKNKEVMTYMDGRYTDMLRECIIKLLALNVGINNVNNVIECVLQLAGKQCSRLPSRSKINDLLAEGRALSQIQLAEELVKSANNTLHTDGTSKFGHKFLGYQVETETQSFTLGIREVVSGTAQATLDQFSMILHELSSITACSEIGNKVLASIKSTMSDRASVEKSFNELLASYRSEILPLVVHNWSELLEDEQLSMARMYNFFCGMHLVVSIAEYTSEAFKLFETAHFAGEPAGSAHAGPIITSEPGTLRLIRTACKAFQRRGDEKSGCPLQFSSFLKSKGINHVPLKHFKGNRYNIIFYNGRGVYYLRNHIVEFLESVWGMPNKLLKAVYTDTKESMYIAGCKALGLIVTSPLWRLLESDLHILDMCKHYADLHTFLCRASVDASAFMVGEDAPFLSQSTSTEATSDVVKVLLEPNPSIDGLVQQLLQAVFQTLSLLVQRVVGKYLAGGEWNEAGDEVREVTKSVSKTNTISERDFGKLDRYIREKPNAGLLALEAHILFTTNKTASWLDEKSDKEKEIMFMKARKLAPQHQKAFRERQKAIEQDRQEALAKKQLALEQRQLRILKEKEKYTREMTEYGLWQTTEEIKAQILRMSTKKRQITALKAQLRFRKHVLQQQHADSSIYQFSDKASGNYSVQRLQENLSRLVLAAQQLSECSLDQVQVQDFLTHKRVSHCFSEEGKDVHYTGTVVSQVPGFSTWYNIVYDNEPDIVYTYQLLEDYNNGDLTII